MSSQDLQKALLEQNPCFCSPYFLQLADDKAVGKMALTLQTLMRFFVGDYSCTVLGELPKHG